MRRKKGLDDIDLEVLRLLYSDPRVTYEMIAEKLGTSAVTVHNRLKKLKEAKLVRERVSIAPQVFDKNVTAFIQISTVPGQERKVAQLISEVPEVIKVKGTTGDFDLIVEIVARDVDELQQLVMDRIRALDNVVRTNTILLLFSVKDELSYVP